jgi:hypothetical protein
MPSDNNIADRLSKLAKLRADGALSEEDFKALKAKMISRVSEKHTDAGEGDFAPKGAAASERDLKRNIPKLVGSAFGMMGTIIVIGIAGILSAYLIFSDPVGRSIGDGGYSAVDDTQVWMVSYIGGQKVMAIRVDSMKECHRLVEFATKQSEQLRKDNGWGPDNSSVECIRSATSPMTGR